jgi:hypothetical protein
MPTLLDPPPPASSRSADAPRVPRRRPAPVNCARLAIPAAVSAIGTFWYLAAVAGALMSFPADLLAA